jgi:hypothetical protein
VVRQVVAVVALEVEIRQQAVQVTIQAPELVDQDPVAYWH